MESTVQGSIEESIWHIILPSLKVEGTGKSHESSEKASSKSGCISITILFLQVSTDNKSSLILEKISIFIKLVGEYLHQGYSIHSVSCDIWTGKSALASVAICKGCAKFADT
jgi:hypothetical protein